MSESASIAEVIPTCVPRSLGELHATVEQVRTFADSIHIDIDDGIFTPESSWPFIQGSRVGEFDTSKLHGGVFDVHLMVSDAREIGENFIKAGARSVIAHIESFIDKHALRDTIAAWRSLGVPRVGLAILLDTHLADLEPSIPFCDFVHVLSVARIGAQGAPFDLRALDRIADLSERHPGVPISVDGGVSAGTIGSLVQAGARRFAIGSAIMQVPNPARAYAEIKSLVENAIQ